ncbi:energy-coupling factor transporter ATPase [Oscillospiraceae bacterium HV4-5-C5C]|nr:energy-coupling factor transporter ATPase [Oscillospiraceae bacterium HV4-5-C5C]
MPDTFIDIQDVCFAYPDSSDTPAPASQSEQSFYDAESANAVDHVSLKIERGEHLAVLGRNGSGKSTLARLINGLEIPTAGSIWVDGKSTVSEADIWDIRRSCGMIFQNPDNQIVATTIEEDVAFGPENLGIPQPQLGVAVSQALAYVGLSDYARSAPSELSGGQKQKLAIAGIIAMQPACLIMDEATSMLDPLSRQAIIKLVRKLQQERGLTIINITHDMNEAVQADRVAVMQQGRLLMEGSPAQVFHQVETLQHLGLDVPVHTAISFYLGKHFKLSFPSGSLATPEAAEEQLRQSFRFLERPKDDGTAKTETLADQPRPQIKVEDVSYVYQAGLPNAKRALEHIDFTVKPGEFFGIMGHSGSGKSTLIQHLNGLLRLQSGSVNILDYDLRQVKDIRQLRRHIQLLFQYPEHQLFAETVWDDIAFGPRRMGFSETEIAENVKAAVQVVGVEESWLQRSPFELSGGEKRRVALAGILAMKPEILVLDEPAAGLDPAGREEILNYMRILSEAGTTVVLVSHNMDDLARLCDRILVLDHGRRLLLGTPAEIFSRQDLIEQGKLTLPASKAFLRRFQSACPQLNTDCFSVDAAVSELARFVQLKPAAREEVRQQQAQKDRRGGTTL